MPFATRCAAPLRNPIEGPSRLAVFALLQLFVLAACSTSAPMPTAGAPRGATSTEVPQSYIIGPGDALRILVLRNADLNADVTVRPDGRISTPLVNDVVAVGKTPTQLGKDIETALGQFVRGPTVSVIVTQPTSRFSQVRVVGQAVSPKAIPYRSGMTVLDLVIEVGGLSQFAAGNRAKIIRYLPGGQTKEIHVRLHDLVDKGRITENIPLEPGDILFIPETLL